MPCQMVHLCVAKKLIDTGFPINNVAMFCLGTISPDAIHMRQGADRQSKMAVHLLPFGKTRDNMEDSTYIKIVNDFISTNKCKTNKDFLFGYAVHILADIHWHSTTWRKFEDEYKKSRAPAEDWRKAYYNDTDIVDYILYKESPWRKNLWQDMQNLEYFDFPDILLAQEIKLWNERTLNFYDNPENQYKFKGEPKYINKSDIDNFISSCADVIRDNIVL